MNIKDFAHYYIGQGCLNTWFPEEHPNYNPGWVLTGLDRGSHRPFKLETEDDFTWTASIKLLLRRLEDMTEDERTEYHNLTKYTTDGVHSVLFKIDTSESFHYLLKQGFDLFNLIEKGLAVDIKNIQPPQM